MESVSGETNYFERGGVIIEARGTQYNVEIMPKELKPEEDFALDITRKGDHRKPTKAQAVRDSSLPMLMILKG